MSNRRIPRYSRTKVIVVTAFLLFFMLFIRSVTPTANWGNFYYFAIPAILFATLVCIAITYDNKIRKG